MAGVARDGEMNPEAQAGYCAAMKQCGEQRVGHEDGVCSGPHVIASVDSLDRRAVREAVARRNRHEHNSLIRLWLFYAGNTNTCDWRIRDAMNPPLHGVVELLDANDSRNGLHDVRLTRVTASRMDTENEKAAFNVGETRDGLGEVLPVLLRQIRPIEVLLSLEFKVKRFSLPRGLPFLNSGPTDGEELIELTMIIHATDSIAIAASKVVGIPPSSTRYYGPMSDDRHTGVFPFGRPVIPRPPSASTPKRLFILGAYPSAFHVSWKPHNGKPIRAMAVDNEPEPFWTGADEAVRLAHWKAEVRFSHTWGEVHGVGALNGSSGLWVEENVLKPLAAKREDAWMETAVENGGIATVATAG